MDDQCVHTLTCMCPPLSRRFSYSSPEPYKSSGARAELANKLAIVLDRHHSRTGGERIDHQPQGSHHARSTALAQPYCFGRAAVARRLHLCFAF